MATASRNGGTAKDFSLGVLEGVEGEGRCGLCLELPLYGCDYQGNAVEIFMYCTYAVWVQVPYVRIRLGVETPPLPGDRLCWIFSLDVYCLMKCDVFIRDTCCICGSRTMSARVKTWLRKQNWEEDREWWLVVDRIGERRIRSESNSVWFERGIFF